MPLSEESVTIIEAIQEDMAAASNSLRGAIHHAGDLMKRLTGEGDMEGANHAFMLRANLMAALAVKDQAHAVASSAMLAYDPARGRKIMIRGPGR